MSPSGPDLDKVTRGGSYQSLAEMCRTRYRFHEPMHLRAAGSRLPAGLRTADPEPVPTREEEPMATLMISSTLVQPDADEMAPDGRRGAKVEVGATTWPEMVAEMRSRFPRLASRILTEGDDIAPAFVLVVNDDVVRHPAVPALSRLTRRAHPARLHRRRLRGEPGPREGRGRRHGRDQRRATGDRGWIGGSGLYSLLDGGTRGRGEHAVRELPPTP